MPRAARVETPRSSKTKLVRATLDLLRRGGLSGAGINQVVAASGAPKGSVYHHFPGGKRELVSDAIGEAQRAVAENFGRVFREPAPMAEKVRTLFRQAAAALAANEFATGCPVAAVTLDLDRDSAPLRRTCELVFDTWADVIAQGLDDVPAAERSTIAQLILATLEGGLVLARAKGSGAPLIESGDALATVLSARFPRRRRAVRRS